MDHSWKDSSNEKEIFSKEGYSEIKRLAMKEGEYTIRILVAPKLFRFHWIDEVNRSINCGPDCELCASGERGQLRYAVTIIDRADGAIKIWEFGRRVKTSIANIADKYGDPTNYDLTIIRKGMKAEDTVYTVIPAREEKALTDAEKKLPLYDLEKLYAVTPKEVVASYLKGIVPERSKEKAEAKDRGGDKIVEKGTDDLPTLS